MPITSFLRRIAGTALQTGTRHVGSAASELAARARPAAAGQVPSQPTRFAPPGFGPTGFAPPMRTSSAPMGPRQAVNLLQQQRPAAARATALPPGQYAQPGLGMQARPGPFPPAGFAGHPAASIPPGAFVRPAPPQRAQTWPPAASTPGLGRAPGGATPALQMHDRTGPPHWQAPRPTPRLDQGILRQSFAQGSAHQISNPLSDGVVPFARPTDWQPPRRRATIAVSDPAARMGDWAGPIHQHAQGPLSQVDQGILRQNFAEGSAHQVSNPLSDGVVPLPRESDWQPPGFG